MRTGWLVAHHGRQQTEFELHSNIQGDQVLTWGASGTAGGVGGALTAPHPVGTHVFDDFAVLPDGTTIAVWVHPEAPLFEAGSIEATTSRDGLHFTRAHVISKTTARIHDCRRPRLVVDREHSAVAEWTCSAERGNTGDGREVVEFARYPP